MVDTKTSDEVALPLPSVVTDILRILRGSGDHRVSAFDIVLPDQVRQYRGVADSNKAGVTTLNHNNFSMSASATNNLVFPFHVPLSWDPDTDPKIHTVGFTVLTDTNKNYRHEFGIESGPSLMVIDGVDDETITFTQPAPDGANTLLFGDLQTISRATLGLAVNDHMNVIFRRLGGDAADDRQGVYRIIHTMMIFQRLKGSFEVTS